MIKGTPYCACPYAENIGTVTEAVVRRCSVKVVFLKISQNSQENTCARVSFLIKLQASPCNFIKKEILAQVSSCEICEIFKNSFFIEHLRWQFLQLECLKMKIRLWFSFHEKVRLLIQFE